MKRCRLVLLHMTGAGGGVTRNKAGCERESGSALCTLNKLDVSPQ